MIATPAGITKCERHHHTIQQEYTVYPTYIYIYVGVYVHDHMCGSKTDGKRFLDGLSPPVHGAAEPMPYSPSNLLKLVLP
jgi:hypothetical protein